MKFNIFIAIFYISLSIPAHSMLVAELGIGWENMGISPSTTWKPYPYSAGSRKELAVTAGLRYLSEKRFYYSPFAKLQYGNDWSLSGAMNLLELNIGILGFGVYISKPMSHYSEDERIGKWFAVFEANFGGLSIGGNIAPNAGRGEREWSDITNQYGNQYYAFGKEYIYFQYSIPLRIQFWNMIKNNLGVGMFVESQAFIFEKSINISMPRAIGYNMIGGFIVVF